MLRREHVSEAFVKIAFLLGEGFWVEYFDMDKLAINDVKEYLGRTYKNCGGVKRSNNVSDYLL